MGFSSDLRYHIFKDLEIPFDEKGATCGTVRLVQWVKEGEEPNIDKNSPSSTENVILSNTFFPLYTFVKFLTLNLTIYFAPFFY